MTSNLIRPSEIEKADEFIVIDVRESDELSEVILKIQSIFH
jgi:hypothetical protein